MAAETEKELRQLRKRFLELAEKSWQNSQYLFTNFLNMAEMDLFYRTAVEFSHVPYSVYGGHESCERKMVRFGSEELFGYEEPFPIVCLCVRPLVEKFADELSHRDFLGACMNLGIDRSTVGDIFVQGKSAYLYCTQAVAPYLTEHLSQIKHTHVTCGICEREVEPSFSVLEEKEFQVASERVDSVAAKVFSFSRGQSQALFGEKKVFVNARLTENSSCVLKKGDVVTVRGYGKFIYNGVQYTTKKGKLAVSAGVYTG